MKNVFPVKKPGLNVASLASMAQTAVKPLTHADIRIDLIDIERQVRTDIGDLTSLANSIKEIGVEVSIIVLAKEDGRFRLIAGERRLRASLLAGLTTIPARIKRAQDSFAVRQTQITENNERVGLSTYDEAMGVANDVETFGFKEAQRIWNRSESWVSKRAAIRTFVEPVMNLVEKGLCEDIDYLISLNQLHELSVSDFNDALQQVNNGTPIQRDILRAKVKSIKVWKKEEAELASRRQELEAAREKQSAVSPVVVDNEQTETPDASSTTTAIGSTATVEPAAESTPAAAASKKSSKTKSTVPLAPVEPSPEAIAAEAQLKRQQLETRLLSLRKEVFEWGDANRGQINSMRTKMQDLELDMNETEWVLWSGFQSMILPMLEALGEDRSISYLKRLQSSLKGQSARGLWQQLHPLVPGSDPADEHGLRIETPDRPEDWRF